MKANQMFLRKLNQDNSAETWQIDSVGNCGKVMFQSVVTVVEPKSVNPGIQISWTFGLRGLKKAIRLIERERKKIGLTTLR